MHTISELLALFRMVMLLPTTMTTLSHAVMLGTIVTTSYFVIAGRRPSLFVVVAWLAQDRPTPARPALQLHGWPCQQPGVHETPRQDLAHPRKASRISAQLFVASVWTGHG